MSSLSKASWLRVGGIGLGVVLLWNSFFVVPETETAIVTLFGKPMWNAVEPGLHFKWPVESLLRFEKRLMVYNPRPSEFLTGEKEPGRRERRGLEDFRSQTLSADSGRHRHRGDAPP